MIICYDLATLRKLIADTKQVCREQRVEVNQKIAQLYQITQNHSISCTIAVNNECKKWTNLGRRTQRFPSTEERVVISTFYYSFLRDDLHGGFRSRSGTGPVTRVISILLHPRRSHRIVLLLLHLSLPVSSVTRLCVCVCAFA